MKRYILEWNIKEQDAFALTRDKYIADFFEKVVVGFPNSKQSIANFIINKKVSTALSIDEFVKKSKELLQPKETDEKALDILVDKLIKTNPKVVTDYQKGKTNAIMFLVGQVMREMKGKADANVVIEKIKGKIK